MQYEIATPKGPVLMDRAQMMPFAADFANAVIAEMPSSIVELGRAALFEQYIDKYLRNHETKPNVLHVQLYAEDCTLESLAKAWLLIYNAVKPSAGQKEWLSEYEVLQSYQLELQALSCRRFGERQFMRFLSTQGVSPEMIRVYFDHWSLSDIKEALQ